MGCESAHSSMSSLLRAGEEVGADFLGDGEGNRGRALSVGVSLVSGSSGG